MSSGTDNQLLVGLDRVDALAGRSIFDEEVPTPFVFVDVDVMRANIERMAAAAREAGVALRPHTKTHKIPEIARSQLEAGAIGVTVAKLGEASALIEAGLTTSYMVAQPFVGSQKLRWYLELARTCEVLACVDDVDLARRLGSEAAALGREVDIVLIVDASGYQRFGVAPAVAEGVAHAVAALPGVRFRGLRSYPGRLYELAEASDAEAAAVKDAVGLGELAGGLEAGGLPCDVVSTGNTPGSPRLLARGVPDGITELRPGNYVFADRMQIGLGSVDERATALRVVSSVVSGPGGRWIVDAGLKTLSGTKVASDADYGAVTNHRGARLEALWEECGRVRVEDGEPLAIGDRLTIVPNHACELPNLAEVVLYGRDDRIEGAWLPVARGKVW